MFILQPDTLVSGVDKWSVEKFCDFDFFWYSRPFEHSKSKGFITPEVGIPKQFPINIVVDLSEINDVDPFLFDLKKTVFYSEDWRGNASVVASFIKNIFRFCDGKWDFVKKDYKIVPASDSLLKN